MQAKRESEPNKKGHILIQILIYFIHSKMSEES